MENFSHIKPERVSVVEIKSKLLEYLDLPQNIKDARAFDLADKLIKSFLKNSKLILETIEVYSFIINDSWTFDKKPWVGGKFSEAKFNFAQHYVKHKNEFPGVTFREYYDLACEATDGAPPEYQIIIPVAPISRKKILYNKDKNIIAIMSRDGHLVTMYRPNSEFKSNINLKNYE